MSPPTETYSDPIALRHSRKNHTPPLFRIKLYPVPERTSTRILAMATSDVVDHSTKIQSLKTQATPTSIFWYTFVGVLATIATILHLLRPDLDFGRGTSMFLWPLSPIRIASPFSLFYSFYLWLRVTESEPSKAPKPKWILEAELRQRLDGFSTAEMNFMTLAGSLSALTLSKDIPTLYFKYMSFCTTDLPTYEAGNVSVELAWGNAIFIAVVYGLLASTPVILAWYTPARLIMYKWKTVNVPGTNTVSPSSLSTKKNIVPSAPASPEHEDNMLHHKTKSLTTTAARSSKGAPYNANDTTAAAHDWTLVEPRYKYDDVLHEIEAVHTSLVSMRGQLEDQCKQENKEAWEKECQRLTNSIRAFGDKCQKLY